MNLEKSFREFIESDALYQEAFRIVQHNSSGKIWLIGGYLSRNLANILYGTGEPDKGDIDFIVEKLNPYFFASDWGIRINSYGNPKLRKGAVRMDVVPLDNVLSIRQRSLEPTIENYLTGVPLTFQSIAYDTTSGKIIGGIGKHSLKTRTIGINSPELIASTARKKGMTIDEYVDKYCRSFGFRKV